jgi:non-homologous end joining protein Ku
MESMAAPRTRIALGAVSVEVSLVKTSSEPKEAKWETQTVNADGSPIASLADAINATASASPDLAAAFSSPFPVDPDRVDQGIDYDDPLGERPGDPLPAPPEPEPIAATKILRGVTVDDGTFVDLTERLAEIDEQVKIDGMEIVAAIGANTVDRTRVRGSSYVVPFDEQSKRACTMLFEALAESGRALVVRWTKRTNQALGIIVGSKSAGTLVLLDVEFGANMKPPPAKAIVQTSIEALVDAERAAAASFVAAIEGRRSDLDGVVDERRRLHAELLTAAREGTLDAYDEAHDVVDAEVIDDVEAELAALVAASA